METNVILKYRRDRDLWLCSKCDTENELSSEKCFVCGCRQSSSDTVLKRWTEADDRLVPPRRKVAASSTTANTKVFKDMDRDAKMPEKESHAVQIVLIIILLLLFIGIIFAASQANAYAVSPQAIPVSDGGESEPVIWSALCKMRNFSI